MREKKQYIIKIEFTKYSWMRFISHLDLLRLFQRALRRTAIALKFSGGFSPHPLIYFERALKLGVESEGEFVSIVVSEDIPLDEFKKRLNAELPEGIKIKDLTKRRDGLTEPNT
ncbi:MAG: DUF2344 domain-containing protein [Candidatus Omnitrophica bacterium]|nr:DUF2344 domain-containing protein [Candidatus Omnitrophota bacterium]